jgi:uncharacterized protein (TIGR03083 family)
MFSRLSNEVVWGCVKASRTELYDYLLTLSPEEWNKQSLCEDWFVRDVVAHLIIVYQYEVNSAILEFLKSGFRLNKFMSTTAKKNGKKDTGRLLEDFKSIINQRSIPFFVPPMNALVDTLIHEQDIRIALGHNRQIPLDLLHFIFSNWEAKNFNVGEKITGIQKRTAHLRFNANDIAVTYGSGLEVSGKAQDILLTIAGRKTSFSGLEGEGTAILGKRLELY